jgi:hypothetical protein
LLKPFRKTNMKRIYYTLIFIALYSTSFGQKLPEIQKQSQVAPATTKIDGKLLEWNDNFAAENKRTEIFYTIANDNKNLYLVLKSSSSTNTNKIFAGGVTFVVNTQGRKSDKDAQSITYPIIKRAERGQLGARQGQGGQGGGGQGGFQNRTQQTPQQRDSINLAQRKIQLANTKEFKVSGFKVITDSLISIYNEYGIKAVGAMNSKGEYVYEMAIPLSLLDLFAESPKEFSYQIKINGLSNMGFGGQGGQGGRGGVSGRGGAGGGGNFGVGGQSSITEMASPTDFWGKYLIIKN